MNKDESVFRKSQSPNHIHKELATAGVFAEAEAEAESSEAASHLQHLPLVSQLIIEKQLWEMNWRQIRKSQLIEKTWSCNYDLTILNYICIKNYKMQTHPTPPNIRRKSKGVNAEKENTQMQLITN